jgi:hypothetical protein
MKTAEEKTKPADQIFNQILERHAAQAVADYKERVKAELLSSINNDPQNDIERGKRGGIYHSIGILDTTN